MKVYTFSTGGCRDGIYLKSLFLNKEGVEPLIEKDIYLDSSQSIKSFQYTEDEFIVTIWDNDLSKSFIKEYDLITFDVY